MIRSKQLRATTTLLGVLALVPSATATQAFFGQHYIKNQTATCQDPAGFDIGRDLQNGEWVSRIHYHRLGELTGSTGLHVESDLQTLRGGNTGVRALGSMDMDVGQKGSSEGRLAQASGFFNAGDVTGVLGIATPEALANFGGTSVSRGLGGAFTGGPDPVGAPLDLTAQPGTFWIGGVYGEVRGQIDRQAASLGAAAGVIGVDSASGSWPSWAGYFQGDVLVTGTLTEQSSAGSKDEIEELEGGLELVRRIRGVRYRERADGDRRIGLIAEELAEVAPELVAFDAAGAALGVDYSRLGPILVQAVKEQQETLEEQARELRELREIVVGLQRER